MGPDAPAPAQCADGLDNDEDGETDFPADRGCADSDDDDESDDPPPECADGRDNDDDGRVDLVDPDCINAIDRTENGEDPLTACSNTLDDDADGIADFPLDPGCGAAGDDDEADPIVARACANGVDDDGDDLTDYPNDPGCSGRGDPDENDPRLLPACANGMDDDGDGATDYPDDQGCDSAGDTNEASTCAGRPIIDLNGSVGEDGFVDGDLTTGVPGFTGSCGGGAGPELVYGWRVSQPLRALTFTTDFEETAVPTVLYVRRACTAAVDLACDRGAAVRAGTTVQLRDVEPGIYYAIVDTGSRDSGPGAFRLGVTELLAPHCQDGIDNDEDGAVDLADPGCTELADEDEVDPEEAPACADGVDNDGDNLTDYPDDPECEAAGSVREGPLCEIDVPVIEVGGRGFSGFAEFSEMSQSDGSCRALSGGEFVIALDLDDPSDVQITLGEGDPGVPMAMYLRNACDDPASEAECSQEVRGPVSYPELEAGLHFVFVDLHDAPPEQLQVTVGVTSLVTACNDGIDNDEDELIDLLDPGCTGIRDQNERNAGGLPHCADGADNDGDGLIDYPDDDGCTAAGDPDEAPECVEIEPVAEVGVEGGVVNFNTDQAIDGSCGGMDRAAAAVVLRLDRPAAVDAEITQAGFDSVLQLRTACDDDNTELDCDDDGGAGLLSRIQVDRLEAGTYYFFVAPLGIRAGGPGVLTIRTVAEDLPACRDDADNDDDGLTDLDDPGCEFPMDNDEADPDVAPTCADGEDNDEDGLVDFPADPGCLTAGWSTETSHCQAAVPFAELGNEGGEVESRSFEEGGAFSSACGAGQGAETVIALTLDQLSDVNVEVFDGEDGAAADISVRAACAVGDSEVSCSARAGQMSVGSLEAGLWYIIVQRRNIVDVEALWRIRVTTNGVRGACSDEADNDEDGLVDAADPGCLDARDDDETDPEVIAVCGDGADNDEDGNVDFPDDPQCRSAGWPEEGQPCGDALLYAVSPAGGSLWVDLGEGGAFEASCDADDGDEAVVALDLPLLSNVRVSVTDAAGEREPVVISVRSDCAEAESEVGCLRSQDNHPFALDLLPAGRYYILLERGPGVTPGRYRVDVEVISQIVECNDEVDNDEDDLIDLLDPGCMAPLDPTEADPPEPPICADGVDNDDDGQTDFPADADCFAAGDIAEVPHCRPGLDPVEVPAEGGDVVVDTTGAEDLFQASCGDSAGGEAVVFFTVEEPTDVVIEVTGAAFNTIMSVRSACEEAITEIACDDNGGAGTRSRIELEQLDAGTYFVLVDGTREGRDGEVTVNFAFGGE